MQYNRLFFILFILVFYKIDGYTTIWRISNEDPSADFAQLSQAMNDANVVNGDILHVEGSASSYEGVNITKRVEIIGPGFFLNQNPNTPSNSASAIFKRDITFVAGSEGSRISGVIFESGSPYATIGIAVNNIYISGCHLLYSIDLDADITGVVVTGCYLFNSTVFSTNSSPYYSVADVEMSNNIFINGIANLSDRFTVSRCENNIMEGNIKVKATYFRNNILVKNNAVVEVTSPNYQNNLAYNGQFGTDNGNQNVDATSVFVGGDSPDGKYQLRTNSPAIGAGFGGTDCGIFGGDNSYRLSGVANIPVIYDLRVAPQGDPVNGLKVTIKARVN